MYDDLIARLSRRTMPGDALLDNMGYAMTAVPDPDCRDAATAIQSLMAKLEAARSSMYEVLAESNAIDGPSYKAWRSAIENMDSVYTALQNMEE